jgi:hypothetical protein
MLPKLNKLIRKIHKYLAVGIGFIFLTWLTSGIFYVVPLNRLERVIQFFEGGWQTQALEPDTRFNRVKVKSTKANYRNIIVSIPEAISLLETDIGHTIKVVGCSINQLSDTLVYEIRLENGKYCLFDAIKGIPVKITEAKIKENAITASPEGSNIVHTSFLTKRPYTYWGPLPVYRFIFDDVARTHIHVSPITGQVVARINRLGRLYSWMDHLHKFNFLLLIWEREAFRKIILLIFALFSLVVVITGFYLTLPVKIRVAKNRTKGKKT